MNTVDDKDTLDEETELLLEEYNQSSLDDVDIDDISDDNIQYEGVKVNIGHFITIFKIIINYINIAR